MLRKKLLSLLYLFGTILLGQNNALDFDGVNDYILSTSSSSTLGSNTEGSISFWFSRTATANGKTVLYFGDSGTVNNLFRIKFLVDNTLEVLLKGLSDFYRFTIDLGSTASDGSWNHIAFTVGTSGNSFFYNGEFKNPTYTSGNSSSTEWFDDISYEDKLHIGCANLNFGSVEYFDGQLDEVRIWDDVRTQAEIKANMHKELSGSESNLVAYYKLNESSGTTATDETSNGNNGTLTNMDGSTDWVSAPNFGQSYALDFDGTDDYISVSNLYLSGYSGITLETWVYFESFNPYAGDANITNLIVGGEEKALLRIGDAEIANNRPQFVLQLNEGFVVLNANANSTLNTGEWYHIAGTWDGSTMKLYINGIEDASVSQSGSMGTTSTSTIIGGTSSSARMLEGKMDEIRIWDDVRTQTEIQDNMFTELSGSESNLVAYYNFDAGRGTSLMDLTSNNYHGTLTNMDSSTDWVLGISQGVTISGNSGFRMMSSPVSGTIFSDLLDELWIQGMTGGDVTDGTANVWTLDVANQTWSALTNLNTASLTAGEGFMVYVFSDTDFDGVDDLPVTLGLSGSVNTSSATLGSIAEGNYGLAGNPYSSTIDWDLVTKINLSSTCYVWDDATPAYKSWNGTTGSLTDGLIAPYQGFWVQASGGTGSVTIETADKAGEIGTFYRTMEDSVGSASITVTADGYERTIYLSFEPEGSVNIDKSDAYQLMPLQLTPHLISMTYSNDTALDIQNLPSTIDDGLPIPLDVMMLGVDGNQFTPMEVEGTMTWDISQLPDHIDITLTNQVSGETTHLRTQESTTFTTQSKASFGYAPGIVTTYPEIGESLYTLTITQSALESGSQSLPKSFELHAVYPNPFNPSTSITFDIPKINQTVLEVFNVKGQLVETLLNKPMQPGTHEVHWTPENLSSGVYMVRLTSGEKVMNQKVTFVK